MATIELLESNTVKANLELIRVALNAPTTVYGDKVVNKLGYLSKYPSINEKSKYKPIRTDIQAKLTEAQKKALNYGNFINSYSSAEELAAAIEAGTAWGYNRKQTGDKCRLWDFNGYDSGAGDWATPEFNNPIKIQQGNSRKVEMFYDGALISYGLADYLAMQVCTQYGGTSGLQLGWLISESGIGAGKTIYFMPLTDNNTHSLVDYVADKIVEVKATSDMSGIYYMYLVLTTFLTGTRFNLYPTKEMRGYSWIPVAYSQVKTMEVTTVAPPVVPDVNALSWEYISANWSGSLIVTISSLICQVYNSSTSVQNMTINAITYEGSLVDNFEPIKVSVPATSYVNIDLCKKGELSHTLGSTYYLTVEYSVLGGGESSYDIMLYK